MSALIQTDSYGTVPRSLNGTLKSHNVPPALFDELREHFGADWAAMARYVKSKGRGALNYGDVFRDHR